MINVNFRPAQTVCYIARNSKYFVASSVTSSFVWPQQ